MYKSLTSRGLGIALFTLGAVSVGSGGAAVIAQPFEIPEREESILKATVNAQSAISQITAMAAHSSVTGDGVKIAVLDSGFDTTHELWSDVTCVGEYDAVDDDADVDESPNGTDDDSDGYTDKNVGHGNFVTSEIHAVAPDAMIIAVRVLDDEGNGTLVDLIAGIEFAVSQGADIINISAVITSTSTALEDAIYDATDAGVLIVTAAGNTSTGAFNDSFVRDRTVTVGAVDGNDAVTSWSPNGSDVDIYAPGLGCLGALDNATIDYGTWDGTSFAAPLVSGAAALALEDDPTRTPAELRDLLKDTSDTVTGGGSNSGGRVDCDAAVNE